MPMPPDDQTFFDLARPYAQVVYNKPGAAALVIDRKSTPYDRMPRHTKRTTHGPAVFVEPAKLIAERVRCMAGKDSPAYESALIYAAHDVPFVCVVFRSLFMGDRVRVVTAVE